MATDPTTGTTATTPADGSATATGTTGEGAAGGSGGGEETIEQKLAKAEERAAEAERKSAQMLSEKSGVEEQRRQNDERQRALDAARTPPAAGQGMDRLMARLQALDVAWATEPDNPNYQAIRDSLVLSIELARDRIMEQQFNHALAQVPEAMRTEVDRHVRQYGVSFPAALEYIKAQHEERKKNAEKSDQLDRERKEFERDKEARARQAVSTGGRPDFGGSQRNDLMKWGDYENAVDAAERRGDRKETARLLNLNATGGVERPR